MAIYSEAMDLGLGVPTPIHAQTEAAELAREAVRRDGWQRRLEREAAALVVDHGRPHIEPWPGEVVPRNARTLIETAKAKGWRVNLIEQPDRCTVEGVRGFEGFRATWVRGRASSASWHEPGRYAVLEDVRPAPKLNEKTRTSIANRRPVGTSRVRLTMLASPGGMPISITELTKRVSAS